MQSVSVCWESGSGPGIFLLFYLELCSLLYFYSLSFVGITTIGRLNEERKMNNFDRQFGQATKLIDKGQKTIGNMILVGAVQVITVITGVVSLIVGLVTSSSVAFYLAIGCAISFCLVLLVVAFLARRRAANFMGDISAAFNSEEGEAGFFDSLLDDDDITPPRQ